MYVCWVSVEYVCSGCVYQVSVLGMNMLDMCVLGEYVGCVCWVCGYAGVYGVGVCVCVHKHM